MELITTELSIPLRCDSAPRTGYRKVPERHLSIPLRCDSAQRRVIGIGGEVSTFNTSTVRFSRIRGSDRGRRQPLSIPLRCDSAIQMRPVYSLCIHPFNTSTVRFSPSAQCLRLLSHLPFNTSTVRFSQKWLGSCGTFRVFQYLYGAIQPGSVLSSNQSVTSSFNTSTVRFSRSVLSSNQSVTSSFNTSTVRFSP